MITGTRQTAWRRNLLNLNQNQLRLMPLIQRQGRGRALNSVSIFFLIRVIFAINIGIIFLGCELFEGSHTAEAVSLKIQEILERFLIKNKVHHFGFGAKYSSR